MADILQTIFQVHIDKWWLLRFNKNFAEDTSCFLKESNWQIVIIVLGNGLVSYRLKLNTWTNDDLVYRCYMAFLGQNKLIMTWFFLFIVWQSCFDSKVPENMGKQHWVFIVFLSFFTSLHNWLVLWFFSVSGSDVSSEWSIEGRRLVPLMPRLVPQTAFTVTANSAANAQAEKNLSLPPPSQTGNKDREYWTPQKTYWLLLDWTFLCDVIDNEQHGYTPVFDWSQSSFFGKFPSSGFAVSDWQKSASYWWLKCKLWYLHYYYGKLSFCFKILEVGSSMLDKS